jgi:dihydrofolate reductase
MTLIGIAAVAKNGALGRKGKIPWHYSEDFKFFKKITSGHAVVAGLTTFEGLPPLKDRLMILLSFEPIPRKDVVNVTSVEQILLLEKYMKDPLFIIGGASVYKAFVPHIDCWWITRVPDEPEDCDAFFPKDCLDGFTETIRQDLGKGLHAFLYAKNRNSDYVRRVVNELSKS